MASSTYAKLSISGVRWVVASYFVGILRSSDSGRSREPWDVSLLSTWIAALRPCASSRGPEVLRRSVKKDCPAPREALARGRALLSARLDPAELREFDPTNARASTVPLHGLLAG